MESGETKTDKRGTLARILLVGVVFVAVVAVLHFCSGKGPDVEVKPKPELPGRPAAVAGQFYPAAYAELFHLVNGLLNNAAPVQIPTTVRALILPHAGYVYSGQVAARGVRALNREYKRVIILASNHSASAPAFGFSIADVSYYETPLGRVRVSPVAHQLLKSDLFTYVPQAHSTHVIEVELPFLQRVLSDFEIVPIITGRSSIKDLKTVAELLSPYLDEQTLLLVSSDLSHYHPYEEASKLDRQCIKALAALDVPQVRKCEACGLPAALILLEIAKKRGWKAKVLDYKNSGDVRGLKDRVVGYSSIVFFEGEGKGKAEYAKESQRKLVTLSRRVLDRFVREKKKPDIQASVLPDNFKEQRACFVTLEKNHKLRGCIGHLVPRMPLYQCVIENTINAAQHDNRFSPVAADELADIDVEVSVLSVPKRFPSTGPDALLSFLKPGKHGVILKSGSHQSTFLPQVWEQLPDKASFLTRLCRKGGASSFCWRDRETEIYTYEVEAFKESDLSL